MKIIHTVAELRKHISGYQQQGKFISLVPTMGNLHEGHLQLVDAAVTASAAGSHSADDTIVIASIFVNPLQFGATEDLDKYPRTLKSDANMLQSRGCDLLFAPSVQEIYPATENHGRDQAQVIVPGISEILEGSSRPGHFSGVATIVTKLFNLVQPDQAIFGEKDYQQLQMIRQMVKELCFPIEIKAVATVRENSGLAMSSRNGFLSRHERQQAAALYKTLQQVAEQLHSGAEDFSMLELAAVEQLNQLGFETDYVSIRASDLQPPETATRELVILVAARLGTTRLIDNLQLQR